MADPNPDLLDRLQELPLFQGLRQPDVARLLRAAHRQTVPSGGFFFHQEDPADRIYILIEGGVKLAQSTRDGRHVLLRIIRPIRVFAVIAMTDTRGYPVSAQAIGQSEALYWTTAEMDAFVDEYSLLLANAMGMVTRSLRDFQEMFRQMATGQVERRLAQALLRLVDDLGDPTESGILIGLPLTRQDLADMIGATLYTVSRTLSQWETEGLIRCGRARVEVLQTGPLFVMAEEGLD